MQGAFLRGPGPSGLGRPRCSSASVICSGHRTAQPSGSQTPLTSIPAEWDWHEILGSWEDCLRMHGLGSWVFTCGCVPSCATQPSLHPLYPTLPACNVTIHNRCKDTLANCTKVKQKVRGQGGPRVGGEGRDRSICLFFRSFPPLCPCPCHGAAQTCPLRPQPCLTRGQGSC